VTGLAKRDKRDTPKGVCHACHASTPQQSVTSHALSRFVTATSPNRFNAYRMHNECLGEPYRHAPRPTRRAADQAAAARASRPEPCLAGSCAGIQGSDPAAPRLIQPKAAANDADSARKKCKILINKDFCSDCLQNPHSYPQTRREVDRLRYGEWGRKPCPPRSTGPRPGMRGAPPPAPAWTRTPPLPPPPTPAVVGCPTQFFSSKRLP